MRSEFLLVMSLVVTLAPGTLAAQAGVRVETQEDEMDSWTYAYARSDRGPLLSMDDRGLVFDRSPSLIFACPSEQVDVVYLYDTELIGEEGTVLIQYRFDTGEASSSEPWPMVIDPSLAAEIDAAVAAMGVDQENPFLEMFGMTGLAATASGEDADAFLAEAQEAERVTIRVTDQFDGETHTDVFSLEGLTDAVEQVRATCAR